MVTRTKGRELAIIMTYAIDVSEAEVDSIVNDNWYKSEYAEADFDFACEVTTGVFDNVSFIDDKITKYAYNWNISRIGKVDKAILRIAIYELFWVEATPRKVIINEAVDLAKKYGEKDSGKFVNGILDHIYKEKFKDMD